MVRVDDIVEAALAYEEEDELAPGEAMLSVLIDLYTGAGELEPLKPHTLRRAWERYTRDLDVEDWQAEWRVVHEGIEVLAANLQEAGDADLARNLRELQPPTLDGTPLTVAAPLPTLRPAVEAPQPRIDEPVYPSWPVNLPRGA